MDGYTVTTIPDTPVLIKETFKKGSEVYAERLPVRLGKMCGSGGEADVFYIENDYENVIKIYKQNKLTLRKKAKLETLIKIGINDRHICSPEKMVCNHSGQFIGFVMKKSGASKDRMTLKQRLLAVNDNGFNGWCRKDIVKMTSTILGLLFKLYNIPNHKILIGDINLDNFVVFSPNEIYLVDVDSIQVDEFPCPVGQDNFVPAELQGVQFSNILRSPDNEKFSVACLLFLCLMNNKNPFACIDGETPAMNIKAGNFPYCANGDVKNNAPLGNWKYLWAFLPDYIRAAFVKTFTSKNPSDRTKITEWKTFIDKYINEFDNLGAFDSEANKMVQLRYPEWMKNVLEECPGCGKYVFGSQINRTSHVCDNCTLQGVKLIQKTCKHCGSAFLCSNNVDSKTEKAVYCQHCLSYMDIKCDVCGKKLKVKRYREHLVDHLCKACKEQMNGVVSEANYLIETIKGDGTATLFMKTKLADRLSEIVNTQSRIENVLVRLQEYGEKTRSVYEKLSEFWKKLPTETEVYSPIQEKLLAEANCEYTPQLLDSWKQCLEKIQFGSVTVGEKNEFYSSYPIYSSCVSAINNFVRKIENQLEQEKRAKQEEQELIKEKWRNRGESFKSFLLHTLSWMGNCLAVFAIPGLLSYVLTFAVTLRIVLSIVAVGVVIGIVFFIMGAFDGSPWFLAIVIIPLVYIWFWEFPSDFSSWMKEHLVDFFVIEAIVSVFVGSIMYKKNFLWKKEFWK